MEGEPLGLNSNSTDHIPNEGLLHPKREAQRASFHSIENVDQNPAVGQYLRYLEGYGNRGELKSLKGTHWTRSTWRNAGTKTKRGNQKKRDDKAYYATTRRPI